MIFYIENGHANSGANQFGEQWASTDSDVEHVHPVFRRFVVVKEMSKEHYCYCW